MRALKLVTMVALVTACSGTASTATLDVSIEHPDADTVSYRIICDDDTATVEGVDLDGADACAALSDPVVRTRLLEGPDQNRACTEIYGGPDVATIRGTIEGESVDTQVDRANGCGIADWDELLADVLPTAVGVTG